MKAQQHSILAFVEALAGPITWAAHFFFLYLTEAFACAGQGAPTGVVRWIGIAATAAALAVLALLSVRIARSVNEPDGTAPAEPSFAFAGPLTLLSMLAIAWTSMPLFLLPACAPAHV